MVGVDLPTSDFRGGHASLRSSETAADPGVNDDLIDQISQLAGAAGV